MRSRLEVWANWGYDNRGRLLVPIVLIMFSVGIPVTVYHFYTIDPDLWDRQRRKAIFADLQKEMKEIETPSNTAISKSEGYEKPHLMLLTTRYRSEATPDEFFSEMNKSLQRRGWIPYPGDEEQIAVRTFSYCRSNQYAGLILEQDSFFNSDREDYWRLSFSMGLRSSPGLFGFGGLPAACAD